MENKQFANTSEVLKEMNQYLGTEITAKETLFGKMGAKTLTVESIKVTFVTDNSNSQVEFDLKTDRFEKIEKEKEQERTEMSCDCAYCLGECESN